MTHFIDPFTHEIINQKNQIGAYIRFQSHKKQISCLELRFLIYRETFGSIVDYEEFKDQYIKKEKSLPDFLQEYNIPFNITLFLIKYHNIPKRTIKQANQIKNRSEKYKKTCIEKYGVENVSSSEAVKEKKRQTCLKNHGVDNIRKSKEYYQKIHKKMIEKYGAKSVPNLYGNANPFGIKTLTSDELKSRLQKAHKGYTKWWDNLSDEQKTEIIQQRTGQLVHSYCSSLETKVQQALDNLQFRYKKQYWIRRKSYDFFLKDLNCIIEVNGDFWHANPEIYSKESILNFPNGDITAQDLWEKDAIKKDNALQNDISTVIYIWETELKNLSQLETMQLLLEKLFNK
jgi:G:T-mismatch repair DNA endonuclease (very short patch repair protein)